MYKMIHHYTLKVDSQPDLDSGNKSICLSDSFCLLLIMFIQLKKISLYETSMYKNTTLIGMSSVIYIQNLKLSKIVGIIS